MELRKESKKEGKEKGREGAWKAEGQNIVILCAGQEREGSNMTGGIV
jgi:hypothetical protein